MRSVAGNRSRGSIPSSSPNLTVVTDTAGLNSIETTLELPKGIIVTGRLIDKTTSRPVPAKYVQWKHTCRRTQTQVPPRQPRAAWPIRSSG